MESGRSLREPGDHEPRFVSLVSSREPTPNPWTDAWLAALAMSLDYELTTFDRGLVRFVQDLHHLPEVVAIGWVAAEKGPDCSDGGLVVYLGTHEGSKRVRPR